MSAQDSTLNVRSNDVLCPKKNNHQLFIYVLTILSAIGGFLFGYDTGVVSGAMLLIRDEFHLSKFWQEAIVSCTISSAWLFSLLGGWLADYKGRKPVIIFSSIIFAVGSILMGVSKTKEMLLIGRIIVGVGIGIASMSVPMYIAESSLPSSRGTLVTINNLFITGGQFIASIVCGSFSNVAEGWRYMLGLAAVPAAAQFFGFLWMPESPRWLISKNRFEEALKILNSIRSNDFPVQEEFENIRVTCQEQHQENYAQREKLFLLKEIFVSRNVRNALFVGSCLQIFQQLSGINTVMYYSASIIQMAGVGDNSSAIWLSCLTAGCNFFFTFIGLFLVDRIGRRILTLGSLSGVVVSLLFLGVGFQLMSLNSVPVSFKGDIECSKAKNCLDCLSTENKKCGFCYEYLPGDSFNGSCWSKFDNIRDRIAVDGPCNNMTNLNTDSWVWTEEWCPSKFYWIPISALGLYLLFFAPGMGPMPWTINSEIYPIWARSLCNSIATSFNWFFNLIVSMTFLSMIEVLTIEGTFYFYAGLAFLGLVILFLVLPDTSKKSLEEMEILFSASLCRRFKRRNDQ